MSNLPPSQTMDPRFKIKRGKLCFKRIYPVLKKKSNKKGLSRIIYKQLAISYHFKTWRTLPKVMAHRYLTQKARELIKRQSTASYQTLTQKGRCQKDRTLLLIKTNPTSTRLKKRRKAKFLRLPLSQTLTLNLKKTFRVSKVLCSQVKLVILKLIKAWWWFTTVIALKNRSYKTTEISFILSNEVQVHLKGA